MNDNDWYEILGRIYDSNPAPYPIAITELDGMIATTELSVKRMDAIREALCLGPDEPIPDLGAIERQLTQLKFRNMRKRIPAS